MIFNLTEHTVTATERPDGSTEFITANTTGGIISSVAFRGWEAARTLRDLRIGAALVASQKGA